MANKSSPLLPSTNEILRKLGERILIARKRRKLTADMVASRAGMSPITLRNVEAGESGVTIGSYLSVMQVLGIEKDMNLVAQKDELGRDLQDSQLIKPKNYVKLRAGKLLVQSPNKSIKLNQATIVRNSSTGRFITSSEKLIKTTATDSMKKSSDLISLIKPRTTVGKIK